MKRYIALLLSFTMLLALTACSGKGEKPAGEPQNVAAESTSEGKTNPSADSAESASDVVQQTVSCSGYWEMVRIDSSDPNMAVTEAEMEDAREQGVAMYLDLQEDGTGVFCFDDKTALTWKNGSIAIADDETYTFTVEDEQLAVDMIELTCIFRKAVRPYPTNSEMEQAGFTQFMEEWVTYPYTTICGDETMATTGEATVFAYEIFESDEGYSAKDGYEWRVATIEIRFFDENAQKFGPYAFTRYEDYYNVKLLDDSETVVEETEDYTLYAHKRIYFEQEVETYYRSRDSWSNWRKNAQGDLEIFYNVEFAFQVPVGYNGAVVALADGGYEEAENAYLTDCDPEYFLLFRLD